MWPFKNKFEKIKRSEVVDSIIELERKQEEEIAAVEERNAAIAQLKKQGAMQRDRAMRLALAKKINRLLAENNNSARRVQYLNANLSALNQLKEALDDREFLANNTNMPLNVLLNNTSALRKFLSSVTGKRMAGEAGLTDALEVFDEAAEAYEGDARIYGVNEDDEKLLAMFELEESEMETVSFTDGITEGACTEKLDKTEQ